MPPVRDHPFEIGVPYIAENDCGVLVCSTGNGAEVDGGGIDLALRPSGRGRIRTRFETRVTASFLWIRGETDASQRGYGKIRSGGRTVTDFEFRPAHNVVVGCYTKSVLSVGINIENTRHSVYALAG
jgi:hypothetical protein